MRRNGPAGTTSRPFRFWWDRPSGRVEETLVGEMHMSQPQRPSPPDDDWIPACHIENRNKFPAEEYLKYSGKYIAWSWDGTQIVACGDSYEELEANVRAAGLNPSRTVFDYVDPPEISGCIGCLY